MADAHTHTDTALLNTIAEYNEFFLGGEISKDLVEEVGLSMLAHVLANRPESLVLSVMSEGGSLEHIFWLGSIIQRIRSLGCHVTIRVSGRAWSAALTLTQFADFRQADYASSLLIHDVSTKPAGIKDTGNLADFTKWGRNMNEMIARLFAERNTAGHDDPAWWKRNRLQVGRDHFLTADEGLELGIIDEVIYPWHAVLVHEGECCAGHDAAKEEANPYP